MRELKRGEPASRTLSANAEKGRVKVVHTVKPDDNAQSRHELTWHLDFANVTPVEMLELAARPVLITKQAAWRKAKNRMDAAVWDNVTFKVRDILDSTRSTADPQTKLLNAARKMSKEELAEAIKLLQAAAKEG